MRRLTRNSADLAFEMPPQIPLLERRRANLAEAAWEAAGRGWVPGFDDDSLVVGDLGGALRIVRVGLSVTDAFGLLTDLALERSDPLQAELCAACDLVALAPVPVQFEACLPTVRAACVLVRGVALPLMEGQRVQIVLSWREVLNRTATARLRRDFIAALRQNRSDSTPFDPFSRDFAKKPHT